MSAVTQDLPELNKLLTPEQTANILGTTKGVLEVWRSTGRYELPFVKVGAKVMYQPDDIQKFIASRTQTKTA